MGTNLGTDFMDNTISEENLWIQFLDRSNPSPFFMLLSPEKEGNCCIQKGRDCDAEIFLCGYI